MSLRDPLCDGALSGTEPRANRSAGFVKRPASFPPDLHRIDMVASVFPLRPFVASFKQRLEGEQFGERRIHIHRLGSMLFFDRSVGGILRAARRFGRLGLFGARTLVRAPSAAFVTMRRSAIASGSFARSLVRRRRGRLAVDGRRSLGGRSNLGGSLGARRRVARPATAWVPGLSRRPRGFALAGRYGWN